MKRSIFAVALLSALSVSAQASELSYSYVDASYTVANFDSQDVLDFSVNPDLDGFRLTGSVGFAEHYYAWGSYSTVSGNVLKFSNPDYSASLDMDLNRYFIGFGAHFAISENTDFITELSYIQTDVEVEAEINDEFDTYKESASTDSNGARMTVGLRGAAGDHFEWLVKANYDAGGDNGDFSGTFGAQYKFNETWGLIGDVEVGDEAAIYSIGVRASF